MPSSISVFDQQLLRRRLVRASRGAVADFLLSRTTDDILDRLHVVRRKFARIADIGTPTDALTAALRRDWPQAVVRRFSAVGQPDAIAELEALPLAAESFDLAVSALALQFANDLPGALVQIRRALAPDGLFLAAMIGGRTLHELRTVLTEAESDILGGVSPRVAPFADVRDMGGLLQRAGFALPVADTDTMTVRYDNLFALVADLRAMGATNALIARSRLPARRTMFLRAAELYAARFADADGRIRATFEIVWLSSWAPHESQQKPAKRGSGQVSLAAVLGRKT